MYNLKFQGHHIFHQHLDLLDKLHHNCNLLLENYIAHHFLLQSHCSYKPKHRYTPKLLIHHRHHLHQHLINNYRHNHKSHREKHKELHLSCSNCSYKPVYLTYNLLFHFHHILRPHHYH